MSRLISIGASQAVNWFMMLRTQGIDITASAHKKVGKEAKEFEDDPSLEEGADVIIAVIGSLWNQGHTLHDIGSAIIKKVSINRARSWEQTADGTWQHV